MSKLNDYLESARSSRESKKWSMDDDSPSKQTPQGRVNSLVNRIKEDLDDYIERGDKISNADIKQHVFDALGEDYEYSHDVASNEQVRNACKVLQEYRDKKQGKK